MGIEIRKGDRRDTENFLAFLQEVKDSMDHKEWFFLDLPEDVRAMMEEGILELWLAMDNDRIAAVFDFIRPGLRKYNYGYDLDFSEKELMQVINLDNAAVHPTYRGLGLQRKMIQIAEDVLRAEGDHILLCTVHPDNRFSLQNVLKQGYTIEKKLAKYDSVRYILRKNLKKSENNC